MMSVIKCERTTTLEGYSSIHAVLQLTNDGMMKGVDDNVRLHFAFVREPQHNNTPNDGDSKGGVLIHADAYDNGDHDSDVDESGYSDSDYAVKRKRSQVSQQSNKRINTQQEGKTDDEMSNGTDNNNDSFTPKTIVTYKIDVSVDYGQMETLLGVDIYALGEHPSVEEAVPMTHEEDEKDEDGEDVDPTTSDDDDCDDVTEQEREGLKTGGQALCKENDDFEEIEMADADDSSKGDTGKGDRFGVFVDPQHIVCFLDRVNMNLNEQSVIYFLLTLPFYEHEWDISGFVLSSMFDDDDDDDDDSS
jgi:hypothetical protein